MSRLCGEWFIFVSKYGDSVTIALLDPNKRPKSALEVRSGSRDTGRSGKGGSGGGRPRPSTTGTKGVLVPRQVRDEHE
eukprot:263583-Amorphochlora_amoeboformis.AAC.1